MKSINLAEPQRTQREEVLIKEMRVYENTNPSFDNRIRQALAGCPNIRLVILFGSLARGYPRPDSDVDLAVAAVDPLGIHQKIDLISELAKALGRPVDLIDLSTAGEPLLGQILASGRRILGDDACYARMVIHHLFNQADFMPYQHRILRERRQAWIGM